MHAKARATIRAYSYLSAVSPPITSAAASRMRSGTA
jgi:hypothetical protein